MKKIHQLIIVGLGPAGLYASFLAGLKNIDAIALESSSEIGGQLTALYPEKMIYDLPGYMQISAKSFIENLNKQTSQYEHIQIKLDHKVLNIQKEDTYFKVVTEHGNYYATYVLLAYGSGDFSPRRLEVSGYVSQENVCYYIDQKDALKRKRIVILGGGDSAVDWANELKGEAEVSIIHRRNDFRAHSDSVNQMKEGVRVYTPYTVSEVIGNPVSKLVIEHLETKEKKTIELDQLCVFYGVIKQKNSILDMFEYDQRGIVVDSTYETSIKGIYAVGNACSYDIKAYVITSALGEVANVMHHVAHLLYPNQIQTFSSLKK